MTLMMCRCRHFGGGWTATIAAAIDPRIKFSCRSLDHYQAYKPVAADYEQGALFGVSDYPDIYALARLNRVGINAKS